MYDNEGRPYRLVVDTGTNTYTGVYLLNLQGDVIGIVDENGAEAVTYKYDDWGKETGHSLGGSYGSILYAHNALKYRGYYQDAETGFYYVSSRYYDPEVGRFINADSQLNDCEGPLGYNLFAYCNNNPVMYSDPTGHLPFFAITAAVGAAFGAVVGGVKAARAGTSVWKGALKGAAIGGAIGLGLGAAAGATLAGNLAATTKAVVAGAKLLGSYVASGGIGAGASYIANNISRYGQSASTMAQVRQRGKMGEAISGIVKSTSHIPSMTGTAKYRIPDGLSNNILSEVKNYTGTLRYTNQLKDFVLYVQNTPGMKMHLYTNATLSGPLQQLKDSGVIEVFPIK